MTLVAPKSLVDIPDNFEGWDNSDHPADPSLHITDYGEGELHSILLADQGQLGLHAYYQEEYADHSSGPGETGHWEEIDWTVTLAGYDSSVSHYVCDADLASTDAVDLGVTGIALEYDWDTNDVKKGWTAYSLNAYSTACDIYLSTHPSADNDYLIEGTFTATVGVEYAYICDNGSNDPYADPECPGALEWFYSDKQSVTITDGRFKMHIKEFEQPY